MEQIRFYLDEHIPSAVADGLRRRAVNVLTVQNAGRSGWSDSEQLSFAHQEQRVLVTMDSDFLVIASRAFYIPGSLTPILVPQLVNSSEQSCCFTTF